MKYGILEFGKLFQNGSIYWILTKQFFLIRELVKYKFYLNLPPIDESVCGPQ